MNIKASKCIISTKVHVRLERTSLSTTVLLLR